MSEQPAGRVRAGDAERDEVVERLRFHHEAGRLTGEEFEERMAAGLSARWRDELPPLMDDLPRTDAPAADVAPEGPRAWLRDRATGAWRGPRFPVLPVLLLIGVVTSIGAVTHGHFPWPALWIALGLFWLHRGPWNRRRAWAASHR